MGQLVVQTWWGSERKLRVTGQLCFLTEHIGRRWKRSRGMIKNKISEQACHQADGNEEVSKGGESRVG